MLTHQEINRIIKSETLILGVAQTSHKVKETPLIALLTLDLCLRVNQKPCCCPPRQSCVSSSSLKSFSQLFPWSCSVRQGSAGCHFGIQSSPEEAWGSHCTVLHCTGNRSWGTFQHLCRFIASGCGSMKDGQLQRAAIYSSLHFPLRPSGCCRLQLGRQNKTIC